MEKHSLSLPLLNRNVHPGIRYFCDSNDTFNTGQSAPPVCTRSISTNFSDMRLLLAVYLKLSDRVEPSVCAVKPHRI